MKEKKHIDRLFQEGFKDFEATPSDVVWKNIEAQLNQKKKKRRIIPIWWRYAGIAALLLLLLTVGGIYLNTDNSVPSNNVVDSNETIQSKSTNSVNPVNLNDVKKETNSITAENKVENSHSNPLKPNEKFSKKINTATSAEIAHKPSKNTNSLINNTVKASTKTQTSFDESLTNEPTEITNNPSEKNSNPLEVNEPVQENNISDNIANTKNNTPVISDSNKEEISPSINKETDKNTLTIEDALAEIKDPEATKVQNKWSIAPNAAPVYFNSLGKGSSIDAQFNENSKSGEVNMSYGITASYAINKKISVRTGLNKVNLGYNTNNVVVFETVGGSRFNSIKNIDANTGSANISLISGESLNTLNSKSFIRTSNTSINQSLGYIEIPLELQYALIDKKIGVHVIGGFSSFFLNNNELYSDLNGQRTRIGEANNINKVSYSANFGLGLNYNITKKLDLNLEPVFKYQINTFNNSTGNFKPFFIGVYTGIGFKF